jgi:hypothetical protein
MSAGNWRDEYIESAIDCLIQGNTADALSILTWLVTDDSGEVAGHD